MLPQNSLVTNFLQNIFLCVQQNKLMNAGLELLEEGVNDDRIKHFGWTIPLRVTGHQQDKEWWDIIQKCSKVEYQVTSSDFETPVRGAIR